MSNKQARKVLYSDVEIPSSQKQESRRKSNRTIIPPKRLNVSGLLSSEMSESYSYDYNADSLVASMDPYEKAGREFLALSKKLDKEKQYLGEFITPISELYSYYPLKHGNKEDVLKRGTHGVHYAHNFAELGYMVEKYSSQIMNWPDLPSRKIEKKQKKSEPLSNERKQEETNEVIIIDDFEAFSLSSDSTTVATQTAPHNDEEAAIRTQAAILSTISKARKQERTGPTSEIINIDDFPTALSTEAASHNNTPAALMPTFSSHTTLSTQATSHNNTRAPATPTNNDSTRRQSAVSRRNVRVVENNEINFVTDRLNMVNDGFNNVANTLNQVAGSFKSIVNDSLESRSLRHVRDDYMRELQALQQAEESGNMALVNFHRRFIDIYEREIVTFERNVRDREIERFSRNVRPRQSYD